jgi:hypothetical protein
MRQLVLLALSATAAVAQTQPLPKTLAAIPVFAGAKSVPTDTEDLGPAQFVEMMITDELKIRSREYVAYEVKAHPEAVYEFYAQRFGGADSADLEELNYTRLKPGQTSTVFSGPNAHEINAKQRAVLGSRPQLRGEFLRSAIFNWATRQTNGDITVLALGILDKGVAADWSSYSPRTRLILIRTTYVNPGKQAPAVADVLAKEMMKGMTDAIKEAFTADSMAPAPSESILGVAMYPGSQYDARTSAQTSRSNAASYVFHSDDDPAQIIEFYRQRLSAPTTNLGADGTVFVIEGSLPMPRFAVYVNQNTVRGGSAKTIITVRRSRCGPDDRSPAC